MSQHPQIALGQVQAIHPAEYAVSVTFPNLGMLSGIRVPLAAAHASRETGRFEMPQRGDWVLIGFYQDDVRSARVLGTLTDAFWNAAPLELLQADPDLCANFERSGRDTYRHGNGDIEVQHPDGSLFRLTHGGGAHDQRTERQVSVTEGEGRTPKRQAPARHTKGRVQVYFEQKDKFTLHIDQDGNLDADMQGKYRVQGRAEGDLTLSNAAGVSLALKNEGEAYLKLKNGATLTLHSDGSVSVKPAAGMPIKLGAGPVYRPVIRELDLGVPPGMPLKATTLTVLASD